MERPEQVSLNTEQDNKETRPVKPEQSQTLERPEQVSLKKEQDNIETRPVILNKVKHGETRAGQVKTEQDIIETRPVNPEQSQTLERPEQVSLKTE
jgi:hypothetical protein